MDGLQDKELQRRSIARRTDRWYRKYLADRMLVAQKNFTLIPLFKHTSLSDTLQIGLTIKDSGWRVLWGGCRKRNGQRKRVQNRERATTASWAEDRKAFVIRTPKTGREEPYELTLLCGTDIHNKQKAIHSLCVNFWEPEIHITYVWGKRSPCVIECQAWRTTDMHIRTGMTIIVIQWSNGEPHVWSWLSIIATLCLLNPWEMCSHLEQNTRLRFVLVPGSRLSSLLAKSVQRWESESSALLVGSR